MFHLAKQEDFDCNKITYSEIRKSSGGGGQVSLRYNGRPFLLQTPEMPAPYGINMRTFGDYVNFTMALSFHECDHTGFSWDTPSHRLCESRFLLKLQDFERKL